MYLCPVLVFCTTNVFCILYSVDYKADACTAPLANDRARILQKPRRGAGLGVMLVGKGGDADEVEGASPCSSGFLQLVGVLGRGRCAGVAAAAGGGGRTGGTRGRLTISKYQVLLLYIVCV